MMLFNDSKRQHLSAVVQYLNFRLCRVGHNWDFSVASGLTQLTQLTQPRKHFCRFRSGRVDFSVINAVATAFRRRHRGKSKRCSQKRRYDSMKTAFWGLDHSA
jgi:hypothetical protein